MIPGEYSFPRYLAAKKLIDDRSLNRQVLRVLGDSVQNISDQQPVEVLEIGAGIGTMVERLIDWGLLGDVEYTAIDSEPENINIARERLVEWGQLKHFDIDESGKDLRFSSSAATVSVKLMAVDLYDFLVEYHTPGKWDLLVAHAFLDLIDLPTTLPRIFELVHRDGWFYFSINYDGLTIFQPIIDREFDNYVLELYHRTMEHRMLDGKQYGDRYTGRNLFQEIIKVGGRVLASGSSDWVVHPGAAGYDLDEAYFLHFIIYTIDQALKNHPELDHQRFTDWVRQRHAQIERQELVYIAHQLDYFGSCKSG